MADQVNLGSQLWTCVLCQEVLHTGTVSLKVDNDELSPSLVREAAAAAQRTVLDRIVAEHRNDHDYEQAREYSYAVSAERDAVQNEHRRRKGNTVED